MVRPESSVGTEETWPCSIRDSAQAKDRLRLDRRLSCLGSLDDIQNRPNLCIRGVKWHMACPFCPVAQQPSIGLNRWRRLATDPSTAFGSAPLAAVACTKRGKITDLGDITQGTRQRDVCFSSWQRVPEASPINIVRVLVLHAFCPRFAFSQFSSFFYRILQSTRLCVSVLLAETHTLCPGRCRVVKDRYVTV